MDGKMITAIRTSLDAKRKRLDGEAGFTLIELLVVVLIIGILAAIAIPIFLNQQEQAKDSAVTSDLGNAKVAYTSYLVSEPNGDDEGDAGIAALEANGFVKSNDTVSITVPSGGTDFCLQGSREGSDNVWHIGASGGVEPEACPA
jgi:type IV pilus assembly protein PilA